VRFQAVASLVELDAARAAPLVRPLLSDDDATVRAQAAAALGDVGDHESKDALSALLADAVEVRHEAALALARLDDRRGLAILVAALGDRERAFDAAAALAHLGIEDSTEARAALVRILKRPFGDPLVKVMAADALAKAGEALGRQHLLKAAHARRDDVSGLAQSVLRELDGAD
jgi:HEAT repeat protein